MSECKPHQAFYGEDDCCPICEGINGERERIIKLLEDDGVMHDIWWRIKREDFFPSQDFIAQVIKEEIALIKGEENDKQRRN